MVRVHAVPAIDRASNAGFGARHVRTLVMVREHALPRRDPRATLVRS
jgi:hypothetical protein